MYYLVKLMLMAHACMVREKLAGVIRALSVCHGSIRRVLGSESVQTNTRRNTEKNTTERQRRARRCSELLTSSCDDRRARLVRMAVYGIREARENERVSE